MNIANMSDHSPMPLISLRNVSKNHYMGDNIINALKSVSMEIDPGDHVAIIGASGSGKSTLMNIMGCLDRPTSGKLFVSGRDTDEFDVGGLARFRNETVGFVFQSFNLMPRLTALENVALPLIYRGVSRAMRFTNAATALVKVGLGDRLDHRPSQLSGGQQQRVAIARALVGNPSLLLTDEPSGALDSRTSQEVLDILDVVNHAGTALVVVTHDSSVACRARRLIEIHDGVIVRDG